MPVHVSSTCNHHQEVKIALHSLWYHHTYRWPSRAQDGHLYVWWYQRLCNAILTYWWWAHVLETCRGTKWTYYKTKILCIKLVNYWDKYTEMHGQQNVKKNSKYMYIDLFKTITLNLSTLLYFIHILNICFIKFYTLISLNFMTYFVEVWELDPIRKDLFAMGCPCSRT